MRLVPRSDLPAGAVLAAPLLFILLLLPTVAVGGSNLPPCSNVQSKAPRGNCQGTVTNKDGSKYVGEFKDGKYNGQSTLSWADGDKYVGEFQDSDQNGQGTFTGVDGDKYVGEYKNGQRNGQGTSTRANGDKYVGEFKGGKPNGQGTYTGVNGDKYVGEFKDDKYNGQGTLTWANGDKYVGEFKNGERNRQGSLSGVNGDKYVGEFKDDKRNGQQNAGASVAQQPLKLAATVIVWYNFGDAQEGKKLIQAGVDKTNPALLQPLVKCIAHEGAGYIVTEGGFYGWSDIIIVDGDQAGCRGTILTR